MYSGGRVDFKDDGKKALGSKQIAAGQKVADWPVTDNGDIFKSVPLLGQSIHDAHSTTMQAMDNHTSVEGITALVLANSGTKKDVSISGILGSLGRSRDSLRAGTCHTTICLIT